MRTFYIFELCIYWCVLIDVPMIYLNYTCTYISYCYHFMLFVTINTGVDCKVYNKFCKASA